MDDMQFERNISYGVLSMRATRMICALGSALAPALSLVKKYAE